MNMTMNLTMEMCVHFDGITYVAIGEMLNYVMCKLCNDNWGGESFPSGLTQNLYSTNAFKSTYKLLLSPSLAGSRSRLNPFCKINETLFSSEKVKVSPTDCFIVHFVSEWMETLCVAGDCV